MKKIFVILMIAFSLSALSSCRLPNNIVSCVKKPKVRINDLKWEVYMGSKYQRRVLLFSFTNYSNYNIHHFEIEFVPSFTFTNSKREEFYRYFEDEYYVEDMEWLKENGYLRISGLYDEMFSEVIKPGESCEPDECVYYGLYVVFNDDWYKMFKPGIACYEYEDNGEIITVEYDYKTRRYVTYKFY